jgi:hypothetical protein
MSSIELKSSHSLPAVKSSDARIMVSYLVVAMGILLVLYALSGSPQTNAAEIISMTSFP